MLPPLLSNLRLEEYTGKTALVRVDFNVPLHQGQVQDNTRILSSIPTLDTLLEQGITIVLMSHLGRPKSGHEPDLCLAPVMQVAADLLKRPIRLLEDPLSEGAGSVVRQAEAGSVFYIENIRFFDEETRNNDVFSKALARLADFFVMDAFGASHRAHASTVGLTQYLPSVAGLLFEQEIKELSSVLKEPKRPFMAIIGGSKISTKFALLRALLGKVDTLLIGGAMSYTLLKAQGVQVGASMVEYNLIDEAKQFLQEAESSATTVILPTDHKIADAFRADAKTNCVEGDIPEAWMGLDIGEKSIANAIEAINKAGFIFWNGPVGVFEMKAFEAGTTAIANAISDANAYSLVGGGDSVSALKQAGCEGGIDFISSGGGASLAFLEGKGLPALEALKKERVSNGF